MARLTWTAAGVRYYEVGVDRGVLYVGTNAGVAWPGLISVQENPSGGEPRPYYQDGRKYLNLAKAEEFEATIEAFTAPAEFGPCDGMRSIQNGLFATQQRRVPFNLSYRTGVGNDTEGQDHAYKIHLVYNALAAPAGHNHTTLSDSSEPEALSWDITTIPEDLSGRKPTAHFVVDSRYADAQMLSDLEDILYGSTLGSASFPTVAELVAIFTP